MVGGLQTRPQLRCPWIVPAWLPFVRSAFTARERPETPPLNLPDAMTARSTLWSKIASNLIRFTSSNLSWQ